MNVFQSIEEQIVCLNIKTAKFAKDAETMLLGSQPSLCDAVSALSANFAVIFVRNTFPQKMMPTSMVNLAPDQPFERPLRSMIARYNWRNGNIGGMYSHQWMGRHLPSLGSGLKSSFQVVNPGCCEK